MGGREGGVEEGGERKREGGKEGKWEGGKKGGREGGREGWKKGGKEGRGKSGKETINFFNVLYYGIQSNLQTMDKLGTSHSSFVWRLSLSRIIKE